MAAALAVSGCSTNESGNIAAVGTGDVTAPPLERIAPGLPGPCGQTHVTEAGSAVIARRPYLQRVTARDAVLVWTASGGTGGTVVVTTPEGAPVAEASASADASAPLPAGRSQWTATIDGLSPGATYCYELRRDGETLVRAGAFASAPAPGSGTRVRALVIGDSGGGESDQNALYAQLETVPFDLMIHTGDIAYDHGALADFESKFFDLYAPLLGRAPSFPASGNHEYDTADAAPFRQVFVLPENGQPKGRERWYSYDWGDIHFVALDTERTGAEQAAWLEADLAANRLRWTVVYGHRPPHSTGEHGDDALFRRFFVPVLEAQRVDLVLAGHDHHYERFTPQNGVSYVVSGGGGRGTRPVAGGPLTAFAESVIHCVVVEVQGDSLTLHAIDAAGREFDSAVIQKAAAVNNSRTLGSSGA
jgi:acid phosphatase type 7